MAALTPSDAVQRVLENVGRVVGDLQCPADVLTRRLDDEYRRLRRRLSAEFPTIYEKLSPTYVIAPGSNTITKPTDCETIRVMERQAGANWDPLSLAPSLNRDQVSGPSFYEMGNIIYLLPEAYASGTYRFFYLSTPPTVITTYEVPDGFEGILIEMASVFARQRHNEMEFIAYHQAAARQIWDDGYLGLWQRYGSHGSSGMNETRG